MEEIITELLTPYIIEQDDDTFRIDDKIYDDKEFYDTLKDKVSDDKYVSYCIVCNFVNREPARGMAFSSQKKLIDYFITVLVSQENGSNINYLYIIIFVVFVIFISALIGYKLH